jgi:WD40 repeat protein
MTGEYHRRGTGRARRLPASADIRSAKEPRRARRYVRHLSEYAGIAIFAMTMPFAVLHAARSQMETVPSPPAQYHWDECLRAEGHLALRYSPEAAFSPDGSTLAIANKGKIILFNLRTRSDTKTLRIRIPNVSDLEIQSANSLPDGDLFVLANGLLKRKGNSVELRSPELAFQWDPVKDDLSGKVDALGGGGGFLPVRYFPMFHAACLYKNSRFILWDPVTNKSVGFVLPQLTHPPHLFQFSPHGQWLILAQIEMNASFNPIVVEMRDHQFVNVLPGHHGVVLSARFSPDGTKLVTACQDGMIRVWSVPGWRLLETLKGHDGPVRWAEFSPHGRWIASAGEDQTVRIWSVQDGKQLQVLHESAEPLFTLAFSPDGRYLAGTSENTVIVWRRQRAD